MTLIAEELKVFRIVAAAAYVINLVARLTADLAPSFVPRDYCLTQSVWKLSFQLVVSTR